MTAKTCLVLGTGTAKPGVIEEGMADQPEDVRFVVLWHSKEVGSQSSLQTVLKWLVKHQREFDIFAYDGSKFPQQVLDAAGQINFFNETDQAVAEFIEYWKMDYALLAFSEDGLNGREYCEDVLTVLIQEKYPVYELNNGCVPLSITPDEPKAETPKAPVKPMVDEIDEIDEGDALADPGIFTVTVLLPGGKAVWTTLKRREAESIFGKL